MKKKGAKSFSLIFTCNYFLKIKICIDFRITEHLRRADCGMETKPKIVLGKENKIIYSRHYRPIAFRFMDANYCGLWLDMVNVFNSTNLNNNK